MTWNEVVLLIVLILLTAQIGVLYYFVKYNSNFLNQIQSINGVQFETLAIGDHAPFFRTYNTKGHKVVAKRIFESNKTLIIFISTGCPTCKSILEHLETITSKYNLNFILINGDNISNDDHIQSKVNHLENLSYIRSTQITSLYNVRIVPYIVLLNQEGIVQISSQVNDVNSVYNALINEEQLNSELTVS